MDIDSGTNMASNHMYLTSGMSNCGTPYFLDADTVAFASDSNYPEGIYTVQISTQEVQSVFLEDYSYNSLKMVGAVESNTYDNTLINWAPGLVYSEQDEKYAFNWYWDLDYRWYYENQENYVNALTLYDDNGTAQDYIEVWWSQFEPPAGVGWDVIGGPIEPAGSTIARITTAGEIIDTDTALDWESSYGTLGFSNDTTGSTDLHLTSH